MHTCVRLPALAGHTERRKMEYPNPMPRLWMFLALGVTLALAQLRHFENAAKLEIQSNLPTASTYSRATAPFASTR